MDIRDHIGGGRYALERQIITSRWSFKVQLALIAMSIVASYVHFKTFTRRRRYSHYGFLRELMESLLRFDLETVIDRRLARKFGRGKVHRRDDSVSEESGGGRSALGVKHRLVSLGPRKRRVCRVCASRRKDPKQQSPHKSSKRSKAYVCRYVRLPRL